MSAPINATLFRLLLRLVPGVTEAEAAEAARADTSDLATKADLKAEVGDLKTAMAELKADLFRHTTDTLIKVTAIYAGLVLLELAVFAFATARLLGVSR
jgi:hypothetical protein